MIVTVAHGRKASNPLALLHNTTYSGVREAADALRAISFCSVSHMGEEDTCQRIAAKGFPPCYSPEI